jgi:hypothetical protein
MMRGAVTLPLIALQLTGCRDDGGSAGFAPLFRTPRDERIEEEVARRVGAVESRLKAERRGRTLETVRVCGFVLLSAGAAAGLVWLRQPRLSDPGEGITTRTRAPLRWDDHRPSRAGRVLDLDSTRSRSQRSPRRAPP